MKNYLDESLEIKWKELDDIPFYEAYDDLIISKDWWIFKKGTTRENI